MKLSLAENIRAFRKQRRMTQEKLAEALGVTVGAVYKWESGQSQPELNLLVEMADFFDTSVDVLLGYRMKDNSLEAAAERIQTYCRTLDPAALTEAEKTMAKYPNSFEVLFRCASVYLFFGTGNHDRKQISRALALLERSKTLLPQNDDPQISEVTICGNMAIAYFLLGKIEKCIELLKQNNASGVFNNYIGAMLAVYTEEQEEAASYLSEALADILSSLFSVTLGFVFVFRTRNDWDSAADIVRWGIDLLTGSRRESGTDALEKTHAEMLVLQAYVQAKAGKQAESVLSLRKAGSIALRFDSRPDFSLQNTRFADHPERAVVLDVFGATASGSIAELIRLLNDPELADQWRKISENE